MSHIKQYLPLSLAYIFLNLFVFIFWWVVTDPGNYSWFSIPDEKKTLLVNACTKLFWIKYYIWVVSLNGLLTAFLLIERKRMIAFLIAIISLVFYLSSSLLFESYTGRNYFIIFLNQKVSPDFQMEPVNDAGRSIGPYLLHQLEKCDSDFRASAAKGLGEIQYEYAISTLSHILNDSTEHADVRAEAFIALKKMKRIASKKALENFSRHHIDNSADSMLLKTIRSIESHDIY